MTQFIFSIKPADDFGKSAGVNYFIYVSTKDYFDKHGCMQDDYDEPVYDELIAVMDKYNLTEFEESSFEYCGTSDEVIMGQLNSEPNFNFSQKLHL